jgi:hypothetical protein
MSAPLITGAGARVEAAAGTPRRSDVDVDDASFDPARFEHPLTIASATTAA